jgi:TatD-related deoxyribonuclease
MTVAIPILDNHLHLQPSGRNVDAVEEFKRAGGTGIILSHMPYHDMPIARTFDFRESYERTVAMARRVSDETGVASHCTLGPYPVEMMEMMEVVPLEEAKDFMMRGLDLAAEYVSEGLALAIGEVGRPHFPVEQQIMDASNEVLAYAMTLAKGNGCAVVVHCESATPKVWEELATLADRAGLPRHRVVKHFAAPHVGDALNRGITPSVLASDMNAQEAARLGRDFMLETDYMDDPRRPGAVLGPATVPRRTRQLLEKGLIDEEFARWIHDGLPRKVYGSGFDERPANA